MSGSENKWINHLLDFAYGSGATSTVRGTAPVNNWMKKEFSGPIYNAVSSCKHIWAGDSHQVSRGKWMGCKIQDREALETARWMMTPSVGTAWRGQ